MKKVSIGGLLFILVVLVFSCAKSDNPSDTPQDAGKWMYWTDSAMYTSHITVRVMDNGGGSHTGYITGVSATLPPCEDTRCFTIKLNDLGISEGNKEGTFYYTAIDSLSPSKWHTWSSAIIVTKDNWTHCNSTLLQ